MAKLRKKLVIKERFWKINAFQPKIKARRGRTGKFNWGQKANCGGLVKELGCQIVTSFSHLLHLCDNAFECLSSLLIRKQASTFMWHSTEKCVLGFTLLWNQLVASSLRNGFCRLKNVNKSSEFLICDNFQGGASSFGTPFTLYLQPIT